MDNREKLSEALRERWLFFLKEDHRDEETGFITVHQEVFLLGPHGRLMRVVTQTGKNEYFSWHYEEDTSTGDLILNGPHHLPQEGELLTPVFPQEEVVTYLTWHPLLGDTLPLQEELPPLKEGA